MNDPILELDRAVRAFGPAAREEKLRLLDAITETPAGQRLATLEDALGFLRAHPDDATVLARARRVIQRLPATTRVRYGYSFDQARRLAQVCPGRIEIDWPAFEDQVALIEALNLCVTAGERQGLEDQSLSLEEWFALCRGRDLRTDLEMLILLLAQAPLSEEAREHLWERSDIPLVFDSPARSRIVQPARRTHWQDGPIERWREPIEPLLRRPLDRVTRGGQEWIDLAFTALSVRLLEIHPLLHASAEDVSIVELPRGLRIMIAGVEPAYRSVLESLYFFLIVENDIPIGYGPAGIFLGCCEFGVNIFPEFRGSDIRRVNAELMRVLHQLAGADTFQMVPYAMGEDNPEALASGAFWFYRKLGFRATNPRVEMLAQREERKMAADPSYRSGPAMLRRLSHTDAVFDLSGGRRRPFPFGRLGIEESRFIAARFGGDRRRAERECGRRLARLLGLEDASSPALMRLAPVLCMIADLARWPRRDLAQLRRIVAGKVGRSETEASKLMKEHPRLESSLRALVGER